MARRCLCARLLAALHEDPRLRTLPLAARMLFLLVAEAAAASPVPGVLPFSGTARVSLLVSAPETDVQTHLETLRAEGLLHLREDGGLAVPLLADLPAKAEAARQNGARGGRPRKGETREAYLQRRQMGMLLPLPGGEAAAEAGGVAETQETQPAKPLARATTTTDSSIEVSKSREGEKAEWVSLGEELVEIAGLDTARGFFTLLPVKGWLDAGSTPDSLRAVFRACAARPGYNARKITSLAYFNRPVEAERERQAPAGAPVRDTPDEAAMMAAIEARIAAAVAGRSVAAA